MSLRTHFAKAALMDLDQLSVICWVLYSGEKYKVNIRLLYLCLVMVIMTMIMMVRMVAVGAMAVVVVI